MKRKNAKGKLILLSVIATGLLGWAAYAKFTQPKIAADTNTAEDQPSTDPNAGKQTTEALDKTEAGVPPPSATTPSATDQAAAASLSVTISRAGQIQQGGEVQIRGLVQGAKSGTCNATLTGPGSTVTASHAVEFEQTGYTCGTFNIPVSQFSAGGEWQLSLTVTAGGQTSEPSTQNVTVTK